MCVCVVRFSRHDETKTSPRPDQSGPDNKRQTLQTGHKHCNVIKMTLCACGLHDWRPALYQHVVMRGKTRNVTSESISDETWCVWRRAMCVALIFCSKFFVRVLCCLQAKFVVLVRLEAGRALSTQTSVTRDNSQRNAHRTSDRARYVDLSLVQRRD